MNDNNGSKLPEIMIKLLVFGFRCSPVTVAKAIGLAPADSWMAGDVVGNSWIKRKENGIEYGPISIDRRQGFDRQIRMMSDFIQKHEAGLRAIPSDAVVKIYCAIYADPRDCSIKINSECIRSMAKVNAQIDFSFIT